MPVARPALINNQVQRCRQFAASEGLSIVAVFQDIGSGNKRYLSGLANLLSFLKANQQGQIHVLVEDLARISQDDEFFREFNRELKKLNAKIFPHFKG